MRGLLTFILILINIAAAQQWEVGVQQIPIKQGTGELIAFWQKGDTLLATFLHKKGLLLTGIQNNAICMNKFVELPKGFSSMKVEGLGECGRLLLTNKFSFQLFQLNLAGDELKLALLYSQSFEERSKYIAKYDTEEALLYIAATAIKNGKTSKVYRLKLDPQGTISTQHVLYVKNKLQVLRFLANDYVETIDLTSNMQTQNRLLGYCSDTVVAIVGGQDAILLEDGRLLTAHIQNKALTLQMGDEVLFEQKLTPAPVQDYLYPVILTSKSPFIVDVYCNGYRKPQAALRSAHKQDRLRLTIVPGAKEAETSKIIAKGDELNYTLWGDTFMVKMAVTIQKDDGRIIFLGGNDVTVSGTLSYGPCLYRRTGKGDLVPIQRLFVSQAVSGGVYLHHSLDLGRQRIIPVKDRKWLRLVYCTPPSQVQN